VKGGGQEKIVRQCTSFVQIDIISMYQLPESEINVCFESCRMAAKDLTPQLLVN
jgi:hypothetical protein